MAQHHSFEPNPVATIPSIHLGVTALLAPLAASRKWRAIAAVYTAAMAFSLVYLGEHYVLDAVAGALAAGIAWVVARRLLSALFRIESGSIVPRTVQRRIDPRVNAHWQRD